jgi:hypothetical protein
VNNHEERDAVRLEAIAPWAKRAQARIESRVADARAHAESAVTKAAIGAEDGRETWRLLARQRSATAAKSRLEELSDWLTGSSRLSLSGLIQDARAKLYRSAFDHMRPLIPPEVLDDAASPNGSGERAARGLILHAKSPLQEIAPVFLAATQSLQSTINACASDTVSPKQRNGMLDSWEKRTADAINQKVAEMLSDSDVAICNLVGRQLLREEFR